MSREINKIDSAILEVLPQGSKVASVKPHGRSNWASTARVDVELADGSQKSYFLKTVKTPDAADRVEAEFASMSEIYNTLPSIAPEPQGHGNYKDTEDGTHFFLADYLSITPTTSQSLTPTLPDPVLLARKLATLHLTSRSPTGHFGFHRPVYDGKLPLPTGIWTPSWPTLFTTLLTSVYALDMATNGPEPELSILMTSTLSTIIPRLLNPLEESIKPTLIHGDLWESNIGTDTVTGEIYIFDACAYYAHHEKEVAMWRCMHHQMCDKRYRDEYFRHNPPSEPVGEADDRGSLYAVHTLLMHSAHFPGAESRGMAVELIRGLVEKYCAER